MNHLSLLDSIKPQKHARTKKPVESTVSTTPEGYSDLFALRDSIVPMKKIIDYLERDLKFQYAAFTLMAFSTGRGFTNSANTNIPSGRRCLEIIDQFADDWDLDSIVQNLGIEGWASGNSFLNTPGQGDKIEGLYTIPLSTITQINKDPDGSIQSYRQSTTDGFWTDQPVDQIAHFCWLPINSSPWGEGLGQALCRKGYGYKTSNGTTLRRPSWLEMNEIMADTNIKIFYSGQSRYVVTPDSDANLTEETRDALKSSFEKLDPLGHLISPQKIKVEQVALTSESKWNTLLERFDKEFNIGTKSSLIDLISSLDFSYASSQTALQAAFPLMDSFNRAAKRFIERKIYYPLVIQDGKNPTVIKPEINWGPQEKLTVEDIAAIQNILNQPNLVTQHNPEDILAMLRECGVPLEETDSMDTATAQQENKLKILHSLKAGNTETQKEILARMLTKSL